MRLSLFILAACALLRAQPARLSATVSEPADFTLRIADHANSAPAAHFPRFGQCQIELLPKGPDAAGLWESADPEKLEAKLQSCLDVAVRDRVNVLVFPELALTLGAERRARFLARLRDVASDTRMVIVAGSYYDAGRRSKLVVVGPGWEEEGTKIRPSRFEASPRWGRGMTPGSQLLVLMTPYGTLAILTCVDLISDDVQAAVRRLANQGQLDAIININHNPASWEFLIEANSIVPRHPVFASITNVAMPASAQCRASDGKPADTGYCYGHTAVFADLRTAPGDRPNSAAELLPDLPRELLDPTATRRQLPYDHLAGDIGAFREGLLEYELNLRLRREPATTNAPDQGYPPIRGIHIVDLPAR